MIEGGRSFIWIRERKYSTARWIMMLFTDVLPPPFLHLAYLCGLYSFVGAPPPRRTNHHRVPRRKQVPRVRPTPPT